MGDPTYFTARLAMLLYAASLAARLLAPPATRTTRLLYTAGCAALLIHIAVAFHVHHHWSHAAAHAHVMRTTARYTGVASGAGLWLNYLAAAVWVADAIFWWAAGTARYVTRPVWASTMLQAFLLFMAVNAAVVFAHGTSRVIGGVTFAGLAVLWFLRRSRSSDPRRAHREGGAAAEPASTVNPARR
jgi:hypothetical protein